MLFGSDGLATPFKKGEYQTVWAKGTIVETTSLMSMSGHKQPL